MIDIIAHILSSVRRGDFETTATRDHFGAKTVAEPAPVKVKAEKPVLKSPRGFDLNVNECSTSSKFSAAKLGRESYSKRLRRTCRTSTEQLVPSVHISGGSGRKTETLSNLRKEVNDEDLNLRVLLLSPRPTEAHGTVSCEKSTINTSSRSGSVTVEVIRLSGAAEHHFRLDVTSSEESCAHVILPPTFRGNIYIDSARRPPVHVNLSAEVRRSMGAGAVRVNAATAATQDEDEIHVHAARNVKLQMAAEEIRRGEGEKEPVWMLEKSSRLERIRRMLRMPAR